ncbi:MAG: phosphodiesterase [Xanthobacter sp.]
MLILQLTDFHITCAGVAPHGIDTRAAFEHLMQRVATLTPQPDLIVISGDVAETGTAEEYAFASAGLRALSIPFVAVPGNHDQRAAFQCGFMGETGKNPDCLAFSKALAGCHIIGLDTLVEGQAHGELRPTQLNWLDEALNAAGTAPVIIVMHHPPFRTGLPAMDDIGLRAGAEALSARLEGRSNIAGILCGHVHRAIFSRFAGIGAAIAPSASHQFMLDLASRNSFTVVTEAPQLMLHRLDDNNTLCSYLVPC